MIPKGKNLNSLPKQAQSTKPAQPAKQTMPAEPTKQTKSAKSAKTKEPLIKTRFPKTEMDDEGTPILNIPGIDDVNLEDTMNKLLY